MYFVNIDDVLVIVNTSTRRLTLRAKPSDTIWDIKAKIEDETGISVYDQQLKLAGKPLPLLDSYVLSTSAHWTFDLETKLGM